MLNIYLFKDYFNNTAMLSVVSLSTLAGSLVIAPFVTKLVKQFGKNEISSVGVLITVILYFVLFILPIKNVYIFVGITFLAQCSAAVF